MAKENDTKQMIIAAAVDLFYEHGFVKASIRDIVGAVGVTNSTFYIHFKNKDQILYKIIQDIGSVLVEKLREVKEKYDDPIECLGKMIFMQTCLIKEKRKQVKIYIEEQYQLSKGLRKKATKQQQDIYECYYNKISEIEDGGFLQPGLDKTVIAFSAFAMMNWAYRWYKKNGRLSIEEVAQQSVALFFNGILTKKA